MEAISSGGRSLAWLPEPRGRLGAEGLERAFEALGELEAIAGEPSSMAARPPAGSALAREPFFRFALPFAAEAAERGLFRGAAATAFRAGAFAWARDPVAPLFALEVEALLGARGRPLRFLLACCDSLEARLGPELEAEPALQSSFGAYFEKRIDALNAASNS
jgi:hypothetical protein